MIGETVELAHGEIFATEGGLDGLSERIRTSFLIVAPIPTFLRCETESNIAEKGTAEANAS